MKHLAHGFGTLAWCIPGYHLGSCVLTVKARPALCGGRRRAPRKPHCPGIGLHPAGRFPCSSWGWRAGRGSRGDAARPRRCWHESSPVFPDGRCSSHRAACALRDCAPHRSTAFSRSSNVTVLRCVSTRDSVEIRKRPRSRCLSTNTWQRTCWSSIGRLPAPGRKIGSSPAHRSGRGESAVWFRSGCSR